MAAAAAGCYPIQNDDANEYIRFARKEAKPVDLAVHDYRGDKIRDSSGKRNGQTNNRALGQTPDFRAELGDVAIRRDEVVWAADAS